MVELLWGESRCWGATAQPWWVGACMPGSTSKRCEAPPTPGHRWVGERVTAWQFARLVCGTASCTWSLRSKPCSSLRSQLSLYKARPIDAFLDKGTMSWAGS